MTALNSLTKKRKGFLNQIYNIVDNQFKKQEENFNGKEPKDIIKELENNSDYIQRIFIDGSWGTGKSYFCEALEEKINEENEKREKERKINFIKINAWETDYFSDPMKSLIGEISSHITLDVETTQKAEQILKNGLTIFGKAVFNKVLEKIGLDKANREELESLFKEVTQFETSELEEYNKYKQLVNDFKETLITKEPALKVIVIDELDRCKPTYAIELLETVKHFFGVKNIIFIFLVNMEQLKSIASTSYLTEDKCSEYFEKFYDIKFTLPSLDYNDFLQIEYNKYNQFETYNPVIENGYYKSNEIDRFYKTLFLEAFNSNCDGESVAPRNFIKSFKKFSLLLSSLSEEEKNCYPLMIILILYFIREEFSLGYKNNDTETPNTELPISLLYLRTFFEKNNGTLYKSLIPENIFYNELNDKFRIKSKFIENDFYNRFYLALFFKEGRKRTEDNRTIINYKIVLTANLSRTYANIGLKYNNLYNNLYFNKINYFITEDFFNASCILFPLSLFNNLFINSYVISSREEKYYHTDILEAWAKEKYSFVLNI